MSNEAYEEEGFQRKVGETLQDYLERLHSVQLHPKRTLLFSIAYQQGHGCVESDVASVYSDLVELVK